jgi:uncharacterized protein YlzI (FlbEa/FlbD family)
MKLEMLPRQEGENIAINVEAIEVILPKGDRTAIHLTSGKVISVELTMEDLIQRLTQQGWRK